MKVRRSLCRSDNKAPYSRCRVLKLPRLSAFSLMLSNDKNTPEDFADLPQSGDLEARINSTCLNIAAYRSLDSGHGSLIRFDLSHYRLVIPRLS